MLLVLIDDWEGVTTALESFRSNTRSISRITSMLSSEGK